MNLSVNLYRISRCGSLSINVIAQWPIDIASNDRGNHTLCNKVVISIDRVPQMCTLNALGPY